MVFSILPTGLMAADKVVVIPLLSHQQPIKNVVTVAKSGGDFTDPVAAVASITDADENHPYLIVIGPGIYTLTEALQLKSYVDLVGSGQNITTLKGAVSNDKRFTPGSLVKIPYNSTLSNLSVMNTGGGQYSTAIFVQGVLRQISATTFGSTHNLGLRINSGRIEHVDIRATGGTRATGIRYYGTYPMKHISVHVYGSTDYNIGIHYDNNSVPALIDADIRVSGGNESYGIWYSDNYGKKPLYNVRISSTNATHAYGIYDFNYYYFSSFNLKRSSVSGETRAIYIQNSSNETVTFMYAS